jgi:hypothetical protein
MSERPDTADRVRRRRRVLAIVGITLLVVASVALTLLGSLLYGLHCTDGDGGVPYVARDSPQKDVCEATGNGGFLLAAMVALIAAFASAAWWAFKRWQAGAGRLAVFLLLMAGIAAAPLAAFLAANAPSDYCSDEQKQAGGDCDKY